MKNIALITTMILLLSCSQTSKTATPTNNSETESNGQTTSYQRPDNIFSLFKKKKSAKIAGNLEGNGGFWIYLVKANSWVVEQEFVDSFKIDGNGEFRLEVETKDLNEYFIASKSMFFTNVFLENGYEIDLKITGINKSRKFEFNGTGSEVNNFWNDFKDKYLTNGGFDESYKELVKNNEPEVFKEKWLQKMERQNDEVDSFMKTKPKPSKDFGKYMHAYIKYASGGKLLTYLFHKPQLSEMRNTQYIQVQNGYYDFLKDYKIESQKEIANSAMNDWLYYFAIDKEMTGRFAGKPARTYAFNYVKDNLKSEVRDAAAGHILMDFIDNSEGNKEYELLKTLVDDYKTFAESNFVSVIEKKFKAKAILAPGAPAPDFTLVDMEGKKISLSDFKGKIVVIDFWGTWCPPCRQQLPFSKKIEEDYKDNDEIVFLFVAMERGGVGPWKQFVNQNELPGIHLYSRQERQLIPYKIESVPRYVIVDKEGNFYDPFASRPSQNMRQQIAKALEES